MVIPASSPPVSVFDNGPALNFIQQRNSFMNLFGSSDVSLMEQELALNPHLLQRIALATERPLDSDLGAQLMKFNSELAGLGGNSLSGGILADRAPVQPTMTPNSFEASNSCDNSQDAQNGEWVNHLIVPGTHSLSVAVFAGNNAADERRRKKKSRWGGSDNEKTFIPGMPTVLPSTLSADQQEAYLGKYLLKGKLYWSMNCE